MTNEFPWALPAGWTVTRATCKWQVGTLALWRLRVRTPEGGRAVPMSCLADSECLDTVADLWVYDSATGAEHDPWDAKWRFRSPRAGAGAPTQLPPESSQLADIA